MPEIALIVSTGALTMSSGSQTVGGLPSSFDTASKSVFDVQAEWRNRNGLALGGEVISYANDLSTTGGAADSKQNTLAFLANAKYYFRTTDWLRPFVGGGAGLATASYSGNVTGAATGLAYQAMAGAEFRFNNRMGLHVQYKHLSATVGSSEQINVGGSGLMLGLGFTF